MSHADDVVDGAHDAAREPDGSVREDRATLPPPATSVAPGWTFRGDVEGLRAVAILLVVAYHAHLPIARGGFIGVDVFFVLSGFLITGILAAEIRATGRVSLSRFWARRARRLLPAAALVVVATLAASAVLASPYERLNHAKSALAFAVYASNLRFARQEADYFAEGVTTDPLLHTWSLSVEEQFYLVYAPLVALAAAVFASRDGDRFRWRLTILVATVSVASLAGCVVLVRHLPVQAFYQLPTRAWEFGAGALLALAPAGAVLRRLPSREALSWLALTGLVASGAWIGEGTRHPGFATVVPVACTIVLIATGAAGTAVGRLLSTEPMRAIGRLSYSWYLWHWPPLVLLAGAIGPIPAWQRTIIVVASLGPAALAYRLVEQPVRESRWLAARSRLSLAGGLALSLAAAVISLGAWRGAQRVIDSSAFAVVRNAREQPRIYADGCHAEAPVVTAEPCVYGAADGDTSIVLFGDSHAAHWFPAIEHVARAHGWRFVPFTKSGCPSVSVTVHSPNLRRRYVECDAWRAAVVSWIASERPAVVFLTNRHTYRLDVDGRLVSIGEHEEARTLWRAGLRRTIDDVQRSGARVIVLQDSPRPHRNPLSCLARAYRDPERCALPRAVAVDTAIVMLEREVAAAPPRADFVSLMSHFCDARDCPVVQGGVAVFRDDSHLSVSFAERLGPALDSALRGAMEVSMATVSRARSPITGTAPAR